MNSYLNPGSNKFALDNYRIFAIISVYPNIGRDCPYLPRVASGVQKCDLLIFAACLRAGYQDADLKASQPLILRGFAFEMGERHD